MTTERFINQASAGWTTYGTFFRRNDDYETPTFLPADVLAIASPARVRQRAGNAGRLRARRRAAREVSKFGRGRARSRHLDREDQPLLVPQSGQGGIRVRPDGRRDSRKETGVRS